MKNKADYSKYECPYSHLKKESEHELHGPEGHQDVYGVWCACGFRAPVFYLDPDELGLKLKLYTKQEVVRAIELAQDTHLNSSGVPENYATIPDILGELTPTTPQEMAAIDRQMSQQTAVGWLIEQLYAPCRGIPSHIIERAKEIEKQRSRKDFTDGYMHGNEPLNHGVIDKWYNETYGGNNE